jgi:hypothetical protein
MKRNWFYIITPCVIASCLVIAVIISSAITANQDAWNFLGVIYGFYLLIPFIIIDIAARFFCKKKAGLIWLTEIVLLALTVILFHNQFGLFW